MVEAIALVETNVEASSPSLEEKIKAVSTGLIHHLNNIIFFPIEALKAYDEKTSAGFEVFRINLRLHLYPSPNRPYHFDFETNQPEPR